MYSSYTLFQAGHAKTAREQREEDIRAGELAAEFGRLWHSLAPRRPGGFRPAPEIEMLTEASVTCSCPTAGPGAVGR
jgi:hypothetical protein